MGRFYVRPYVCTSVRSPPLELGWLAGPQSWLAGPLAWLAGSQAWLAGPQACTTNFGGRLSTRDFRLILRDPAVIPRCDPAGCDPRSDPARSRCVLASISVYSTYLCTRIHFCVLNLFVYSGLWPEYLPDQKHLPNQKKLPNPKKVA